MFHNCPQATLCNCVWTLLLTWAHRGTALWLVSGQG